MKTGKISTAHPQSLRSLKEDWSEIKKHLKTQYPQLSDKDLHYGEGQEDALIAGLQKRLGKSRAEVIDCLWGEWSGTEEGHHRGTV